MWSAPSHIDTTLDSRAATFENPTGARGAGGSACGGRKGAPSKLLEPGERVVLLEARGPGTVRHVWMTIRPAPPEVMRAFYFEVFYDGGEQPSVSVPCLDFFGLPHGRPVPYSSQLTTAQGGRGLNSYVPMPFTGSIRIELVNGSELQGDLYYQVDYTLGPVEPSYLHVAFRRENPTTMGRDFTIAEGFRGPGRFLGCVVGVRVIDPGTWYGEGEVKIYRDGDEALPTICGTGLEDYIGTAWGLGAHAAPFAGAPLDVRPEGRTMPDYVGFYRWHVPDPVVFTDEIRVAIQQIGIVGFYSQEQLERFVETHPFAGKGMLVDTVGVEQGAEAGTQVFGGLHERVDDFCAAAFVYCTAPQAVPRVDVAAAVADLATLPYEEVPKAEALDHVMPRD